MKISPGDDLANAVEWCICAADVASPGCADSKRRWVPRITMSSSSGTVQR